ncbi:flagellar hook-basal body complex protein FliE [Rhizobium alvei]|uniref:Flagellar hook-basal body complex protein FliE n=1 Tax=Rhizobium alvei TaxID=1132659 RepID=A0ABT8YH16_9HYPH|nr:flagellar hook-basal body complex protein FliE [Rhizobium alvei]MDO6962560.1 flagellar hook-basal body complex protein FliE [Rhizobium alvei]
MIDSIQALNGTSIASALKSAENASETNRLDPAAQADMAGASFASYIGDLSSKFVDNIKQAETKSIDGMLGKASVREVVESVMAADQTLQTAMAFRDKVVAAYLDIVKMQI